MPLPASPPKIADSPFASMRGHHMGIRYPDFATARAFWVDTMGWRVLQTWPYGDLTLAYVLPPNQDDFPPGDPGRARPPRRCSATSTPACR